MPLFSGKTKLNHILDAAVTGQVEKVRKLLANGDFPPDSPELIISFRSACNNDNAELAALLLDYGIDVNIEIFPDWSAFNGAIEEMSLEVIRLLIKRGANINRRNQYGQTPLHHAIDIEMQAAINCAIEPSR
jgi:ankyrin repeat protein